MKTRRHRERDEAAEAESSEPQPQPEPASLDLRDPPVASAQAPPAGVVDLDNPFATGVLDEGQPVPVTTPAVEPGGPATASQPAPAPGPAAAPTRVGGPVAEAPVAAAPAPAPAEPVAAAPAVATPAEPTLDLAAVQPHGQRGSGDATDEEGPGFLPARPARLRIESVFVRLVATAGVIGIGTAVGAILVANDVAGWITGLVVSALSVVLAAVLWRSRRL